MNSPTPDIARLILKYLKKTHKYQLACVNKFWYNFIKKREWKCVAGHEYHCRLCTSRINNRHGCCNPRVINICVFCQRTFCKHLQYKHCKKCNYVYDKNPRICGFCTVCPHGFPTLCDGLKN